MAASMWAVALIAAAATAASARGAQYGHRTYECETQPSHYFNDEAPLMAFAHPSTRGPPSTETLARRRRRPARIAGESGRLFAARGSDGKNANGGGAAVEKGADGNRTSKRKGSQGRKKGKSAAKKSKKGKKSSTTAQSDDATTPSSSSHDDVYIQFSRAFQRHVVYRGNSSGGTSSAGAFASDDEVVQSFEFLDDAVRSFPKARILAPCDLPFPPPSCSLVYPDEDDDGVAGGGGRDRRNSQQLTVSRGRLIDADVEEEECETTIAGMGLWTVCELEYPAPGVGAGANPEQQSEEANAALRTLLQLVSSESFVVPRHFFRLDPRRLAMRGHTPASITMNHFRMVNLLSCGGGDGTAVGLAMDPSDVAFVLQNFPQLCLYDGGELEGLILFLLQPLPPDGTIPSVAMVADGRRLGSTVTVDWPCLAGKGYGAGLTVEQATNAIRMMPELLALYYEDSRKPSVMYLYNQMNAAPASPKLIDEANARLNLEGTDGSDAYTFAHLRSLGISWGQLRILASALPLWTTCNLEPGWELLQKGPVRSMLKRPALDYLRQRLQIGPSDVYRLLKTHGRLSTYDACKKILPTLDMIQGRLGLSSAELRKLVLRMPSVMGVGQSSFAERVAFFTEEAGLSVDDVRNAALKQPSLLQYSVEATLRQKLHFFIDELGMSQTSVARVLRLAPAALGLSLADNLRPKLVSMMQFCALDVREIGQIVTTSPQTLLLSQKGKIEPVLKFLSHALMLKEPRDLGEIILTTPRVMVQGVDTSLSKKLELLTASNIQKSREVGVAIARKNPALLALSNSVLEDRIDRCPAGIDIATWLQPTRKGRKRLAEQSSTQPKGAPVIASSDANALFSSVTRIYPSVAIAAKDQGIAVPSILEACQNGTPVDGTYLYSLADLPLTSRRGPATEDLAGKRKVIPVRMFCSGAVYPRDSADAARGQRKTGGLAVQVFTDGSSHDKAQFLKDFSAAAQTCFGIRVPIGEGQDGSELVAIFPLMNPSRNRCELFACSGALRICEELLKGKQSDGVVYDVRVYTDSSYAWKYVKSKQRLLELGSYATSQEMLEHLQQNVAGHAANIDILHPLARSFSRINGRTEPADMTQQTLDNAHVEFVHSMDRIGANDDRLRYVKRLQLHARSAAMWQFNRERNNLVA